MNVGMTRYSEHSYPRGGFSRAEIDKARRRGLAAGPVRAGDGITRAGEPHP